MRLELNEEHFWLGKLNTFVLYTFTPSVFKLGKLSWIEEPCYIAKVFRKENLISNKFYSLISSENIKAYKEDKVSGKKENKADSSTAPVKTKKTKITKKINKIELADDVLSCSVKMSNIEIIQLAAAKIEFGQSKRSRSEFRYYFNFRND